MCFSQDKGSANKRVVSKTGFASQSQFGSHFNPLVHITSKQYIQDSKNVISFEN
jgi:hypothetical protein